MEKIYYIQGLGCPNCAAKMETQVGKIAGVVSSTVSFVNKKLILEVKNDADVEVVYQEALKRMNIIEDHIELVPYDEYKKSLEKQQYSATKEDKRSKGKYKKEHTHGEENKSSDKTHEHGVECACHEESGSDCGDECTCREGTEHNCGEECNCHEESEHNHETECNCHQEHGHNHSHDNHHQDHQSNNNHGDIGHTHGSDEKFLNKNTIITFIGILIYLPTIILSKLGYLSGIPEIILFVVAYILVAHDILWKSAKNIAKGQVFDEFFLMSVATIGALFIKEFPEAVAVMLFYKVGEFFQDKAVDSARHSIKALVNIKPEFANVMKADGSFEKVNPSAVEINDIIEVKPGERIPLDGIIVNGASSLDVSAVTGEGKLQDVAEGDKVYSGTVNKSGLIRIKVLQEFAHSTVARIMDMVENASDKKSQTEQFITKFARVYTPIVVFLALFIAIAMPILTKTYDFQEWIYKALSFLVVSCPCALVISVPLGFFGGIGVASKNGILFKGGNYLEALANVDTIAFDKTGTLTLGEFQVKNIFPMEGVSEEDVLLYAAYGEHKTNHPIAKSILSANKQAIDESKIETYEEIAGYGVMAQLSLGNVVVGNSKIMDKFSIKYEKANTGNTVVYVALNGEYKGAIEITDTIKANSRECMEDLKRAGIKHLVLLSGDSQEIVDEVAKELGIEFAFGQLLPEDKLNKIEEIYKDNPEVKIAFVGDGINDAPVLARADLGIAMGGVGQDAAIEAADMVLMTDELSKIVDGISIAKFTRQIVMENIIFALFVKAFVLLLVVCGISSMWMAVFADVGVSLIAVINSIRVYRYKLKR